MKVNDIVEVRDSSYSMTLIKGTLAPGIGNAIRHRHFRVLAVSGAYPTKESHFLSGTNDLMLVDTRDSNFVLFTQERFCRVVTVASPPERKIQLEVFVPCDIKNVHLVLE